MSGGRIYPAKLFTVPVPCPSCGADVRGFSVDASGALYTLQPCLCQVDQLWGQTFSAEMDRRDKGLKASDVSRDCDNVREHMKSNLIKAITALYVRRDAAIAAGLIGSKATCEREICSRLTELGKIAAVKSLQFPPITLDRHVVDWARQTGKTLPRGTNAPVAASPRVNAQDIHRQLSLDPSFAELTSRALMAVAMAMHRELRCFVTHKTPLSQATLRVLAQIVPDVSGIPARNVEMPEADPDPAQEFASRLSARKRRRIDVIKKKDKGD